MSHNYNNNRCINQVTRVCVIDKLSTNVIKPISKNETILLKGNLNIEENLICDKSIQGPISVCNDIICSACLQENCNGFSWIKDINDTKVETQLCANCIHECVLQFHAKQMWIDKNGDPLSNLKTYFDAKINVLSCEFYDISAKLCDKFRDELHDKLYDELRDELYDTLRDKLYDTLRDRLHS